MDEKDLQQKKLSELKNIKFFNQAEQIQDIYLFKSIEDAESSLNEKYYRSSNMSIAVILDLEDDNLINLIDTLYEAYTRVIFICNRNNFSHDEISKISFKTEKYIYQTSSAKFIGSESANLISQVIYKLNQYKYDLLGITIDLNTVEYYTNYLFYKNMIIKIWSVRDAKYRCKSYFKILTNYSFKIINIFKYDDGGAKKQDVELEITDFKGDISHIVLSATDKSSLSAFRKNITPTGNFVDVMTNDDFNKIINQLYLEDNYETIYKYDRPGLIADKNVYLTANEVIELEN